MNSNIEIEKYNVMKELNEEIYNLYKKARDSDTMELDIKTLNKLVCYNRVKMDYHNIIFDDNFNIMNKKNIKRGIELECIYNCFQELIDRIENMEKRNEIMIDNE